MSRTMLKRVLSGLVGIPLLLFCVFCRGGLPFTLGITAVSLIAVGEFYGACRKNGIRPLSAIGMIAAALFLLAAHSTGYPRTDRWSGPILTGLTLVAMTAELVRKERAPVRNVGATLLGALYGGWLFRYLILLRMQGAALLVAAGGHLARPWPSSLVVPGPFADPGAWVVLLVFFSTWACDTGAFFAGRAYGAHKLAPAISPGKTVEGMAGGLLCAVIAAVLVCVLLLSLDARLALALGALVGLLAPVGDLCESALKRELGIKDFSGLLPGHGGVLDRFDSLLMTAPIVYYVLRWLRLAG